MAINLAAIKNELLPGLRGVQGKYKDIPTRWSKFFDTGTSKMALERTTQMAYLPLAREKAEGATGFFDNNAGERYQYNQEHKELFLGYTFTRKAIEDNLYKQQFNPSNLGLQRSFSVTKEIYGANVLNTGETYDSSVGGDGKALFATDHPIDGSTIANKPEIAVGLNESTLLNGMTAIQNNWADERGLKIGARAKCLIVPTALQPTAIRLLKTELRPGTANNDVNAIHFVGGGLNDMIVNEYLTSDYAWFLRTDQAGLLYLQRVAFEMDMHVDFTTQNLLVSGYERYSFSYNDWRSVYGSFPTN